MPGISEASGALKLGLMTSPLALLLTVVGMASPYWLEEKERHTGHSGLWVQCVTLPDMSVCQSLADVGKLQPDAYPGRFVILER